jgi:flagellar hook-associated protein 1 FlgK
MSVGLFGIARSALTTHQTALQVVSNNVANAETEGYSRQEARLVAGTPVRFPYGSIGTGVRVDGIERKRDLLADAQFRDAAALSSESTLRDDLLSQVEEIFGEPSDAGMASALDQFWSSWSDLATSPGSNAARAVVQQRGRQVAQLFQQYDTQLTAVRDGSVTRLQATIDEINAVATQVADLNGRILGAEAGGTQAPGLRDERDRLIDRLADLGGARTVPQADGSVSVLLGNTTLVDGNNASPVRLELDPPSPPPAVTPADVPYVIKVGNSVDRLWPLGGQVKALADVVNTEIPTQRSRLDAVASSLVSAVNTTHTTGYTFSGTTIPGTAAGNFFDPGTVAVPVRASTIRLDAAIEGNAELIAASDDPNAPLDNGVAASIVALRSDTTATSWTSPTGQTETDGFLGFFRTTVTRLGLSVRTAADDAQVRRVLADQADARRQSVSGVNLDEELVQLLRTQQAYTAATKLVSAADEMLQTLLQLV